MPIKAPTWAAKNTAQGSKNCVCWKSQKIGPEPGLGWIWESFWVSSWWQMLFLVEKMSAGKQSEKRYPRKVKQVPMGRSQGSWTAPLKSKEFWVINNNCTRNHNNSTSQQKNKQLQSRCFSSTVVVCVCVRACVRAEPMLGWNASQTWSDCFSLFPFCTIAFQVKSSEIICNQLKPDEIKWIQMKSSETRWDQMKQIK